MASVFMNFEVYRTTGNDRFRKTAWARRYRTVPRAATGQTASTAAPRTPYTSSTMLLTTQQ
jgi:hypothetical protein